MQLPRNAETVAFANQLRKNMTRHEKRLWYEFLADYPIRFRRQETIGPYVVDFFCSKAGLYVELDGSQHFKSAGITYDEKRTDYLESLGLQVVRFSNLDIDRNFEGVCIAVDAAVCQRLGHPSVCFADSSPQGEP